MEFHYLSRYAFVSEYLMLDGVFEEPNHWSFATLVFAGSYTR